jgi:hypothetical protein
MLYSTFIIEISRPNRKFLEKYWKVEEEESSLSTTAQRILGRRLQTPFVVGKTYEPSVGPEAFEASWVRIIMLSPNKCLFVVSLETESDKYSKLEKIRLIKDKYWTKFSHFGINPINAFSLYATVGSVGDQQAQIENLTQNGWAHITTNSQRIDLEHAILRQIIIRVAIERSILIWSTSITKFSILHFKVARAGMFVRRWPTQLLIDKESAKETYANLRNSLNLEYVRTEVLERSRSWWTSTATIIGLISIVATLFNK